MSSTQRIVLLVVAAVILIVGIAIAGLSGDDEEPGRVVTATEEVAPPTSDETGTTAAEEPPATTEAAAPPPRVESVGIENGGPAGEPKTLEYESGETIRLRFTSEDDAAEVHIHGYDRYVQVPAGGSRRTRFKANAEGIFEIEHHGTGELLAKLEVRP